MFSGRAYLADSPKYKAVGVLGTELGLEWGGNWTLIVDHTKPRIAKTLHQVLIATYTQGAELIDATDSPPLRLRVEDIQISNEHFFAAYHDD